MSESNLDNELNINKEENDIAGVINEEGISGAMDTSPEGEVEQEKKIHKKHHILWILSIVFIVVGGIANLILKAKTAEYFVLFAIGPVNQLIMARACYIMIGLGLILLPLSLYYNFWNEQKIPFIITCIATTITLATTIGIVAWDEYNIIGYQTESYQLLTHGKYQIMLKRVDNQICGYIDNVYYLRCGKYNYSYVGQFCGDELGIKWEDEYNCVTIYNGHMEIVSYDYSDIYTE